MNKIWKWQCNWNYIKKNITYNIITIGKYKTYYTGELQVSLEVQDLWFIYELFCISSKGLIPCCICFPEHHGAWIWTFSSNQSKNNITKLAHAFYVLNHSVTDNALNMCKTIKRETTGGGKLIIIEQIRSLTLHPQRQISYHIIHHRPILDKHNKRVDNFFWFIVAQQIHCLCSSCGN